MRSPKITRNLLVDAHRDVTRLAAIDILVALGAARLPLVARAGSSSKAYSEDRGRRPGRGSDSLPNAGSARLGWGRTLLPGGDDDKGLSVAHGISVRL